MSMRLLLLISLCSKVKKDFLKSGKKVRFVKMARTFMKRQKCDARENGKNVHEKARDSEIHELSSEQ